MESRKMGLKNLFAGQQWRNRHREQTYGHGEKGGEGEMYGESITWKLTVPYVKQIANGNLLDEAGNPNQVLCENLEGWDVEGGGREIQEGGDICRPMVNSCCCMTEIKPIL